MKKGMLNVAILVLLLINLVMTLVLTFSIVPAMNNSNKLITKIASIIDLQVVDSSTDHEDGEVIPPEQKEVHKIAEKLTNKFAEGTDGEVHYATGYAAIYLNKEHEDFESLSGIMGEQDTTLSSQIKKVLAGYTMEEFDSDITAVEADVLATLQEYFDSTAICEVALDMVSN